MLTVQPLVSVQYASVEMGTLGILSPSVDLSPAPPVLGTNADCTSSGRTAVCKCKPSYTGDPYTNCRFDPCSSNPCGQGAICENNGRAAICKCPPKHIGGPYVTCRLDPCQGDACGPNADCSRSGERAVCTCRGGYIGSPYSRS